MPKWVENLKLPIGAKFMNAVTFNLVPRLKKLSFFPQDKIAKIASGLEQRFAREMIGDPAKLTTIIKFSLL